MRLAVTAATVAPSAGACKSPASACPHEFRFGGPAKLPKEGSSCERPGSLCCVLCGLVVTVDCHSTRTITCEPCGLRYRENVKRIARVYRDDLLLVTITAPGAASHKRQLLSGHWVDCDCGHGIPVIGGERSLGGWNASMGERWNRLVNNGILRDPRFWWLTITDDDGKERVSYFKASEAQRRGLLHIHALVRVRRGVTVTESMLHDLSELAQTYGFGHVLDVQAIEGARAAHYVAKYVSKGTNDRPDVPWVRERSGFDSEKLRSGLRGRATYRCWTSSRTWPATMRGLRQSQHHYVRLMAVLPSWEAYGEGLPPVVADWAPGRPDSP